MRFEVFIFVYRLGAEALLAYLDCTFRPGTIRASVNGVRNSAEHEPGREKVIGIPVDCVTMSEALGQIEQMISERKPSLVVTADATAIMIALDSEDFRKILDQASLITTDGAGVVWALKRQGITQERVSGVDLLDKICALSADKGYRLFFLGAEPGIAEAAAERLRLMHPGVNIVGSRHGYFPAESDEIVAAEIAELKPDVLFVALGMPRQETFIVKTQAIVKAPVAIGVGGSFDVFSGKTKRAPKVVQSMHLEWLWRLMLNPRKISKVKTLPGFFLRVLRSKP